MAPAHAILNIKKTYIVKFVNPIKFNIKILILSLYMSVAMTYACEAIRARV
jgi:hypothetical protein